MEKGLPSPKWPEPPAFPTDHQQGNNGLAAVLTSLTQAWTGYLPIFLEG